MSQIHRELSIVKEVAYKKNQSQITRMINMLLILNPVGDKIT